MSIESLRRGRERTARRCREVAHAIATEAGVARIEYHARGLRGRALVRTRTIHVPPPTTRRRLYVFAHECGHVALDHRGRKTRHRQEYEAELYALAALRRHGVPVPEKEVRLGKLYVATKIVRAVRRGAKTIDADAAAWCWDVFSWPVREALAPLIRGGPGTP